MTTLHRPETSSPVDFVIGPSDADGSWQCMFDMDVLFPADANPTTTTTTLIDTVVARSSRDSGIDSISPPSDSPAYRRSSTRSSSPFIASTMASSWPPTASRRGSVQPDSLRRRTLLGNADTGCALIGMPTLKHTQDEIEVVDVTTPTQIAPATMPQPRAHSITQTGACFKQAKLPGDYRTHNNTSEAPMGIRIIAVNRDQTSGRMMFTVRVWFEHQVGGGYTCIHHSFQSITCTHTCIYHLFS